VTADGCPECLRYALVLITGRDLDQDERRAAIRALAAHLAEHTERSAA
jgi:hypothetical protein